MGKTKIAITLAKECAKLDPAFIKQMANEGLTEALSQWPE